MTVEQRVIATGGRTTGFDYIRIALAISILAWHTIIVSYGKPTELLAWQTPPGIAFRFVLPMFFALSGFLVAGSLDRCQTLVSFFGLRVIRIVPALAVEITLSALIVGPLLTSRPLGDYFGDIRFASYFLNIIGDIHYTLPGLFDTNPLPTMVNNQLWTIPFELQCYLVLGGLAVAGVIRSRWLLLAVAVAAQLMWAYFTFITPGSLMPNRSPLATGQVLIIAFLCGLLVHLFRDRILLHWAIAVACLILGSLLARLPNGGVYLPFPAAYLTVYFGLLNPPTNAFLRSGDYSYGLYLYGYPIQQVVASWGSATHHWWINLGLALPFALGVAVLSWRNIEKPALAARRRVFAIEAQLVRMHKAIPTTRLPRLLGRANVRVALTVCVIAGIALLVNGNSGLGTLAIVAAFAVALFHATSARRRAQGAS